MNIMKALGMCIYSGKKVRNISWEKSEYICFDKEKFDPREFFEDNQP